MVKLRYHHHPSSKNPKGSPSPQSCEAVGDVGDFTKEVADMVVKVQGDEGSVS